jgi:hypothetical protein
MPTTNRKSSVDKAIIDQTVEVCLREIHSRLMTGWDCYRRLMDFEQLIC